MASVTVVDSDSSVINTVITVDFPGTYTSATDKFVVIYSRNNAGSQTFGSNVTATEIANNGGRLAAYLIEPDTDSETNFTITGTNSFWSWALLEFNDIDVDAISAALGDSGNNTSSALQTPNVNTGRVATGDEIVLSVGGTNSTASWTTSGNTLFNTTSGNAALLIEKTTISAGALTGEGELLDRGNDGTPRLETSITLVVSDTVAGALNPIPNPSFELGATIATDWVDESNVIGTPTYSLSTTTGVNDGDSAQRVQYSGVSGDATGKVQFYAIVPGGFTIGNTVQLDIWITGSMTNAYGIIGVEAFEADTSYISDTSSAYNDSDIDPTTPTKITVQYTIPPLSDYLAIFLQFPAFPETGVIDIYFDKAVLTDLGVVSGANNSARRLHLMEM